MYSTYSTARNRHEVGELSHEAAERICAGGVEKWHDGAGHNLVGVADDEHQSQGREDDGSGPHPDGAGAHDDPWEPGENGAFA